MYLDIFHPISAINVFFFSCLELNLLKNKCCRLFHASTVVGVYNSQEVKMFLFHSHAKSLLCFWNRFFKTRFMLRIQPNFGIFKRGPKRFFIPLIQEVIAGATALKSLRYPVRVPLLSGTLLLCRAGEVTCRDPSWQFKVRLAFQPFPMKHHVTEIVLDFSFQPICQLNTLEWSVNTTWKRAINHLDAAELLIHNIVR